MKFTQLTAAYFIANSPLPQDNDCLFEGTKLENRYIG